VMAEPCGRAPQQAACSSTAAGGRGVRPGSAPRSVASRR
jgi:hypothetical protein